MTILLALFLWLVAGFVLALLIAPVLARRTLPPRATDAEQFRRAVERDRDG